MMVTTLGEPIGNNRRKQFCSIIMREGVIKRGSLVAKMGCSSGTFAHEYKEFLEAYPNISYNIQTREFSYNP